MSEQVVTVALLDGGWLVAIKHECWHRNCDARALKSKKVRTRRGRDRAVARYNRLLDRYEERLGEEL